MSLLCRIYVVGIVQLLQILETSSVLVSRMKLIPSTTAKITDRYSMQSESKSIATLEVIRCQKNGAF